MILNKIGRAAALLLILQPALYAAASDQDQGDWFLQHLIGTTQPDRSDDETLDLAPIFPEIESFMRSIGELPESSRLELMKPSAFALVDTQELVTLAPPVKKLRTLRSTLPCPVQIAALQALGMQESSSSTEETLLEPKLHSCDTFSCNANFSTPKELNNHLRDAHKSTTLFICDYPDCKIRTYSTTHVGHFKDHLAYHKKKGRKRSSRTTRSE